VKRPIAGGLADETHQTYATRQRDQLTTFDQVKWIDDDVRGIIEQYSEQLLGIDLRQRSRLFELALRTHRSDPLVQSADLPDRPTPRRQIAEGAPCLIPAVGPL
jgi:hypothetical protein